jgi:hypothetical protein
MIAMSMLAMAMVICLFGGYVDSPNEHRLVNATKIIWQKLIHKQVGERK